MPHRRTLFAKQMREAARLVSRFAHRDFEKAESVNLLEPRELSRMLADKFNVVVMAATNWEKGEVISDSRGAGTQQVRT